MIRYTMNNKKLTGILSIIPRRTVKFINEIERYEFSEKKSLKLMEVLGLDERRLVKPDECSSDLSIYGLDYLLNTGQLTKEEIGALIVVTQTPDYFMPPNSYIIHGELGLNKSTLCFDITQGCTGYIYGLLQAFILLQLKGMQKILLIVADTLSKKTSPRDRNTYPLIGDAAAITIIENADDDNLIEISIQSNGKHRDWLTIPAGGLRNPSSPKTKKLHLDKDGNFRSDEDFHMNGAAVFTFTQGEVANSIRELIEKSSKNIDDIDYFLFHQPNKFMLQKLAKKLGIPEQKMPTNIVEKFGNSSSATIPLNICYNLGQKIHRNTFNTCLSGFGMGLSCGTILLKLGPMKFCDIIEK